MTKGDPALSRERGGIELSFGRRSDQDRRVLSCVLATISLVVAALIVAIGPATDSARAADEPFSIKFDQSAIEAGLVGDLGFGGLSGPSSIEGTIDEQGIVKIPKGGFQMPVIDVSTIARSLIGFDIPVDIEGYMGVEQDATGTFDRSTGRLEIDAKAGIWVSLDPQQLLGALGGLGAGLPSELGLITGLLGDNLTCGFSPMDVTFTTESTSLGSGERFTKGPEGPGALAGEWSRFGPFAGKTKILGLIDACTTIRSLLPGLLSGTGGGALGGFDLDSLLSGLDELDLGPSSLTITRTLDESTPDGKAKLKMKVSPGLAKAVRGKAASYRVTVRNSGTAPASAVKVCSRVPKKAVRGTRCRKMDTIPSGGKKQARFKLRMTRMAKRTSYKVRFRMTATGGISRVRPARIAGKRR